VAALTARGAARILAGVLDQLRLGLTHVNERGARADDVPISVCADSRERAYSGLPGIYHALLLAESFGSTEITVVQTPVVVRKATSHRGHLPRDRS
jgi:hypothetical protein